jgi:PPM family protein phosphatase
MSAPASDILVSVFARTDTGMRRPANEDAFLVADLTTGRVGLGPEVTNHRIGERGSLMVVSDGMGGAAAGEIASEMAVKEIREALMTSAELPDGCDQLREATKIANERIWSYANQNPQLAGMGATLTAVLVQTTSAYIAQVGDSRAYLIRGSQIKQLTKDQSLAQLLVDSGAIGPDQASSVPQNVIMQALGTSPTVDVAMAVVELCRNDQLVVCSDGLSNKVTAEEIRNTVEQARDLTSACRNLIEIANERGGEDNITVIAARFDGEALHSAAQSNSITGSFRILSQGCFERDLSGSSGEYASAAAAHADEFTTLVLHQSLPQKEDGTSVTPKLEATSASLLVDTKSGSGQLQPPLGTPVSASAEKQSREKQPDLALIVIAVLMLLLMAVITYFALR